MRSKSLLVRSSRNSLHPNPSPAPLPDGANEGVGSGVNTTQCDADVEAVPDSFDERDVPLKKRRCRGKTETSSEGSKTLSLDACIVCEISDERVIRCAGIGCFLSFHGECVNAEDLANSFCPYCWFKFLTTKTNSLREKAVEAEKAVSKYLDKEMNSTESVVKSQEDANLSGDEDGNEERSEDGTDIISDQELQGEKDVCSSKEEQVEAENDSDKSKGETMPLTEEIDQPEEDKGKLESGDKTIDENEASEDEERVDTERFQDAEDDKDDETAKDQTNVNTRAGKKGEASPFLSMQESFSGKEQEQVKQNEKPRRRRQLVLNDIDSEISSNESTNERNGEDVTGKITSSAKVTSPSGKMKNHQRKVSETTNVAKPKTARDIFFNKDQRRRLYWTLKEEEMLKVGVEKFAAEANKYMPWRKVLEMGKDVFHETRTPADLKDKWRNMIGRR
ncbi:unnamed protein product [Microthlaspi erraticum]|uniref:Myb-like domain-containing protein n=1 Tax=Microthlaspi erraticum TaxID=1685480 RepID=A0A6D2LFG6_9BRAS|nr:unnamed protein product [Microthlaspi erraticum]CAA7058939.1 unnamed protein product [Microthlaspi erraticum]CAA7060741.1 unnamed protein product [Microthlaspi erraticum]